MTLGFLYYRRSSSVVNLRQFLWELCPFWNLEYWKYTVFHMFSSYMLWHIELKCCIRLCFTVLQMVFECRQFASIFVGVYSSTPRSKLKEITNPFWKDVLHSLCDFVTLIPKRNILKVLKYLLWHNCFIKIDKRQIFIKRWYDSGIILIKDLFTDNGDFMIWYDFQQKYNFTPPFTTFQGIKLAVLSTWPELRVIDGVSPRSCEPSFID